MARRKILVTGGAGFIGSHMCTALSEAGIDFVILDDFSNSNPSVIDRLQVICAHEIKLVEGSLLDEKLINEVFSNYNFTGVIHFAAKKAVGESVSLPLEYYTTNLQGTLCLLNAMKKFGVKTIVFSSSATVYSENHQPPYDESSPLGPSNPYGRTKLMTEQVLEDLSSSDPSWNIACLRYFNPIGAHHSGMIGEDPQGIPNNLLPFIAQVAEGRRSELNVYGADYSTKDGTGVRDYIHVMDLVHGHLAALEYLENHGGLITVNLGSGQGTSVLEMVKAFETASEQRVKLNITDRRPGDLPASWANPSKAEKLLKWKTNKTTSDMCNDIWRWQCFSKKLDKNDF